jgi:hypothetical protein
MAWPTTPATTTHLDAGTDDPGLARPQIKQNVDNVNAIIDEFGDVSITTPADGEVLTYVSANSRWENATASSGGGGAGSTIILGFDGTNDVSQDGAPGRYYYFTEVADPDGHATITTGRLTLATGDYIVECSTFIDSSAAYDSFPEFRNVTSNVTYADSFIESGPIFDLYSLQRFTVSNATHLHELKYDASVNSDPVGNIENCIVRLTKIS